MADLKIGLPLSMADGVLAAEKVTAIKKIMKGGKK